MLARVRSIPTWQITLGVALLGLGFLIAAQLAAEAPRVRYTTQERSPLIETATGLQAQQEELKTKILDLRAQIGDLEHEGQGSADLGRRAQRPVAPGPDRRRTDPVDGEWHRAPARGFAAAGRG